MAAFAVSVGVGVAALRTDTGARASDVVLSVIDGDTVVLARVGRARLVWIDAPERGERCYEASRDALRAMLARDHPPSVRAFGKDPYRRELVALWVDGLSVNVEMVRLGRAKAYSLNGPLAAEIAEAESAARIAGLGLWSAVCAPSWAGAASEISTGIRRISAGFPQKYQHGSSSRLSGLARGWANIRIPPVDITDYLGC